jgi:excinuclease ABC subunit A
MNTTKTSSKKTKRVTENNIFIKGARVHNLKNIDVEIPRNKFTVVTGVSGSGKSSLTIDTLFAE